MVNGFRKIGLKRLFGQGERRCAVAVLITAIAAVPAFTTSYATELGLVARVDIGPEGPPTLRYTLTPRDGAANGDTLLVFTCNNADQRSLSLTYNGKGIGSILASKIVMIPDSGVTMVTRGERIPRNRRLEFSLLRLERGNEPGDWLATFRAAVSPEDVLSALNRALAFELPFFGVNKEAKSFTLRVVDPSGTDEFVSECQQQLDMPR